VATAYQDNLGFWWVVDSLLPEVLGIEMWMQQISKWDGDKQNPRLRYYFTEANKFQPQPGYYNQKSFNLWFYNGYFRDLLNWYRDPAYCVKK
jgi:3-methyladenine DNA glycosylase AlkD